jgi:hypothetical protein
LEDNTSPVDRLKKDEGEPVDRLEDHTGPVDRLKKDEGEPVDRLEYHTGPVDRYKETCVTRKALAEALLD